ncbi:MAG: hypothetical protein E7488_00890 [Ruminococcaceae bacterium]|nr:hypothetical protein [Oscillospiraceae bacterium]
MSKKKKIIIALFFVSVAFIAFRAFVPQYFFDEDIHIDILSVDIVDSNGIRTEISDEIDIEHLEHVLHLMQCSRTKNAPGSYQLGEIAYYIYLSYDNTYYQISLTDTNVYHIWNVYTTSGHKIKNGDVWFNMVHELAV